MATATKSTGRRASKGVAAPVAYHHGDLRNAMVREGRALLEERGAGELSLRETARRAGVSEAAPSRHFEGKDGLLAAIAAEGFRELAAQREVIAAAPTSTLDKARDMMLSYVRYAQANKGVFNLMVGPRIFDSWRFEELMEQSTASFNIFSDTVVQLARESGWPASQLELVAHGAWALEHGLATLILADRAPRKDRHLDLDGMIDFSIDLLLSGVTAGPKALKKVR
jgi:AcrR family transcriptional regulator